MRLPICLALLALGCDRGGLVLEDVPAAVASSPADGQTDVPRDVVFRVFYDRNLAPGTVHRGTVRVRSGPQTRFLSVRFDPVARAVVATDFGSGVLEPNVEYEIDIEGVRDLDGQEAEPFLARFVTGEGFERETNEPPTYADAAAVFDAHCVRCHGSERADLGLRLDGPDAIRRTALGVPARQTGGREGMPVRSLDGMPIVDLAAGGGRPATSYLVYKMLGEEHVLGEVMPPTGALDEATIDLVARWILAGAPLDG